MAKYRVYGIMTATKFLGVFEADTKEQAQEHGLSSTKNHVSLCHQCSDELSLDDYCCHDAIAELDD